MRDLTKAVITPEVSQAGFDALGVPVHRASTILFKDMASYARRHQRGPDDYAYGLYGTPTTKVLEAQLSALEGGVRTVILPSGQSAVTIVLLAVLKPGDVVLLPDTVYPPVMDFCIHYLAPRGITHRIYDPRIGAGIAGLIDDRVKLIWTESPGSATMEVQDIPAIVQAAHARGVLVGCDNSWATPLLFKPLAHGVDFSMQSLTKYAGGHSDLLLGSVAVSELGLRDLLRNTMRMLGIGVSPDDVSLTLRGIQTMGVRLAHAGRVAQDFAERLAAMPGVGDVLHPALPGHPGHEIWRRDFAGASGLFSIALPSEAEPRIGPALAALKTFALGSSFGATRSLIAPMSVRNTRVLPAGRRDGTILRLSIGLEDPQDLWADLEAMFTILRG